MVTAPHTSIDEARELLIRYGGDQFDRAFTRARGSTVWDDQGREILDFTSGQMCATIGHNHPALIGAMQKNDVKRGVATLCIGGGEATAIAVERAA